MNRLIDVASMQKLAQEMAKASGKEGSHVSRFIDVASMQNLVRKIGVAAFIEQLVGYIESDFRRWNEFIKTPRVANHSDIGVIELMPTSDDSLYGFKYVNGHPKNALHNQLTVMSFAALAEVETGFPILFSEFTLATALRTAATSVMAAKYLARKNATSMAVIGNGAQSEFQIIAFNHVLGIRDFYLYDIDQHTTEKLKANLCAYNLNSYAGINLHSCHSVAEAVKHADIITTITADKANATIISKDMVKPGMHLNAVGGDCPGKTELDGSILNNARVVVEFTPQSRIEGEIQQMPADFAVTELWQIIRGEAEGRESNDQITVFDSVGFAIEDFSTLRFLHNMAEKHGIYQEINLIPHLDNPKDLFQLVR